MPQHQQRFRAERQEQFEIVELEMRIDELEANKHSMQNKLDELAKERQDSIRAVCPEICKDKLIDLNKQITGL